MSDIDSFARRIEQQIQKNREYLDSLPEFESRHNGNTVQLKKVINGDIEGLVTGDE